MDWFKNDALFKKELEAGHEFAGLIVARLLVEGIPAQLADFAFRDTVYDRRDFTDETDITVPLSDGTVFGIESKSRRLKFTDDPSSYPYKTALVDTVSGWEQKIHKPRAVVLISQKSRDMLVISPARSKSHWSKKKTFDRVRKINDQWYECPKSDLTRFDTLIDFLLSKI